MAAIWALASLLERFCRRGRPEFIGSVSLYRRSAFWGWNHRANAVHHAGAALIGPKETAPAGEAEAVGIFSMRVPIRQEPARPKCKRRRERNMIARRCRYFRGRASNPQQRPFTESLHPSLVIASQ